MLPTSVGYASSLKIMLTSLSFLSFFTYLRKAFSNLESSPFQKSLSNTLNPTALDTAIGTYCTLHTPSGTYIHKQKVSRTFFSLSFHSKQRAS